MTKAKYFSEREFERDNSAALLAKPRVSARRNVAIKSHGESDTPRTTLPAITRSIKPKPMTKNIDDKNVLQPEGIEKVEDNV